ncbi:hypothetical protein DXA38_19145 [[Clostridium] innocuum]|uniref:Uncharacterized protein n=1 Tax=Clostridium innocuum TaxID=1522 RepID=A0A3E2VLM2_CLOIN|nr:hypothetical protein DXA38_19145 [[Clostridium] innocuum]RHV60236.1 hypothetical protein DXB22_18805 [Clostridiaceae bacterium OM02-2AC]
MKWAKYADEQLRYMCINIKMMQFPTLQLSFLSFPLCQKTTSETGAEDATVCLSCSLQCTRRTPWMQYCGL